LVAGMDKRTILPNSPNRFGCFHTHREMVVISLSLLLLAGWAAIFSGNFPANADNSAAPVLVELFTSEGCSSCPPADDLLARMDALQPVPGTQLIVLSEHVDYWNHDGWMDPFSSASITDRQSSYERVLGVKSPFTPQFLVDGTQQLQANDAPKILAALQQAGATPKIAMRILSPTIEGENPVSIQGRIESDANPQKHKADVFVAIALDHAESQVSAGENHGRHLTHVAVVADLAKIGKLEPGKSFAQDFHLKLKLPPTSSKTVRLVVFAQESGPGKVLGVAQEKIALN
jgi:hypothetical protein